MTYIITKLPHALDPIWSAAIEAVHDAQCAMDDLGDDFTNAQLDAAGDVVTKALHVIWALPARNIEDCLYKLSNASIEDSPRTDCDVAAIMKEATALLENGLARGLAQSREASHAAS